MNLFFMNSIGVKTWGGGEKWMLITACALRERGHKIFFCGRKDSQFLKQCAEAGFDIFPLQIKGDFGLINIVRLYRIFKKKNIDVIVANFNKDVRLAGVARLFAHIPVLTTCHGLPILQNNWRYRFSFRFLVNFIITVSNDIKNRYLTYGWLPPDFITVIHNGIEPSEERKTQPEAVLAQYGIPEASPVISIFGRLVKQKQHHIFLEVAKNILKDWPEAVFLIVGDGPLMPDIKAYSKELGIMDNVYFLGYQEQVMDFYSVSDVLLLTSEDEGMPYVILEAMDAGVPVVAFEVGGVGELVADGETGFLVPPNDIFLMTQRVQELLLSPEMRLSMGRKGRERILRHFTKKRMIDDIESLFQRTLKEKKGGKLGA